MRCNLEALEVLLKHHLLSKCWWTLWSRILLQKTQASTGAGGWESKVWARSGVANFHRNEATMTNNNKAILAGLDGICLGGNSPRSPRSPPESTDYLEVIFGWKRPPQSKLAYVQRSTIQIVSRWHSDYAGHAILHTAITRILNFLIFFGLLTIEGIIILVLADLTLPRFPVLLRISF